jgi:hypothetical protein
MSSRNRSIARNSNTCRCSLAARDSEPDQPPAKRETVNIHCICLVRDEVDILPHTLRAALDWADTIYACDNGSTDGTWELLQDFARDHPQVVLAGRNFEVYRNSMVADVANRFLANAGGGDWWCRLDADEIYAEDPRGFLRGLGNRVHAVEAVIVNYYFTEIELAAYDADPTSYLAEWTPSRPRHYLSNWSELRFVRHQPGVLWDDRWPRGIWDLRPAPQRILMRHYEYRSPPQIQRRIYNRVARTEPASFSHEKMKRWVPLGLEDGDLAFPGLDGTDHDLWRSRVVRSAALSRDDGNRPLEIDWDLLPPPWKPHPIRRRAQRYLKSLVGRFQTG